MVDIGLVLPMMGLRIVMGMIANSRGIMGMTSELKQINRCSTEDSVRSTEWIPSGTSMSWWGRHCGLGPGI